MCRLAKSTQHEVVTRHAELAALRRAAGPAVDGRCTFTGVVTSNGCWYKLSTVTTSEQEHAGIVAELNRLHAVTILAIYH